MRSVVILIIIILLSVSACEKDDICVDGNTPLLVIRFYDAQDTTALKTVSSLVVRGFLPEGGLQDLIPNASLDSIALPLRVGENNTTFYIAQNLTPNDTTTINIDILTFNYLTREVFVSRACGFVANYGDLSSTLETSADNWIERVEIVDTLVANSTSAHVKVFH